MNIVIYENIIMTMYANDVSKVLDSSKTVCRSYFTHYITKIYSVYFSLICNKLIKQHPNNTAARYRPDKLGCLQIQPDSLT